MPSFDVKSEAQRTLHAGLGAADLAIETVRTTVKTYVNDAQKRFSTYQKDAQERLDKAQKSVRDFDFKPSSLRDQATHVVTARVDEVSKDAKARREAIEKRVAELQSEAQKRINDNVETAVETFDQLAKRGEVVVHRLRKETSSATDPGPYTKQGQPAARSSATKRTPATKAPAKRSAAKKAPAKKSAPRATAKKTSTAKKATTSS